MTPRPNPCRRLSRPRCRGSRRRCRSFPKASIPSRRATRRNFQCLPNIAAPQSKRADQTRGRSEHLSDGCFAVGTDDGGLDAEALQVGQHRRDSGEQRYLARGGEFALSHVADDRRQLPHGHVEPRHDFARRHSAQSFHFVVADGREIESRDHVLERGAKPGKGIRQRAVEVENDEAITGHGEHQPSTLTCHRRRNSRACPWSRSRPRAGRRRRPSASRR